MAEPPRSYKLSDQEKKYLDEHGFLIIKELIDSHTLYSCKHRFSQICKGVVDNGSMLTVKEPSLIPTGATGEDLINKVHDIHYDEVFSLYSEHPRLLDVMSQLIGEDLSVINSMLINKPPGTSYHPPHQDLLYFPFRPTEWIMAAWTAIDHVTLDNGCLYVIPGSHRDNTLYEHGTKPDYNRFYYGILDEAVVPQHKRIHLEMSPGDTVFFHPLLVHGSGPNVSKRYRKSITAHYANSHCRLEEVNRSLTEEVEAQSRKKGMDISYTDAWLFKRKQVKGVNSKL